MWVSELGSPFKNSQSLQLILVQYEKKQANIHSFDWDVLEEVCSLFRNFFYKYGYV